MISKQKDVFNKLVEERLEKITKLDKKVNSDDLIYKYKDYTANAKFYEFVNALNLLDTIRDREITLPNARNDQAKFNLSLRERSKVNKKCRTKEQNSILCNIEMLYKARSNVINFFDDYSLMDFEEKHEATNETGIKILTVSKITNSSFTSKSR